MFHAFAEALVQLPCLENHGKRILISLYELEIMCLSPPSPNEMDFCEGIKYKIQQTSFAQYVHSRSQPVFLGLCRNLFRYHQ